VSQAPSHALAILAAEAFLNAWGKEFPTVAGCSDNDFDVCTAHLKLPIAHRRLRRTTNLLGRLLGEGRWRTKTIPHVFGERAVMKQMQAALIRASQTWRGVTIMAFERKQLDGLRDELAAQFDTRQAWRIPPVSGSRNCSKQGQCPFDVAARFRGGTKCRQNWVLFLAPHSPDVLSHQTLSWAFWPGGST
jgi:hypothetical protein